MRDSFPATVSSVRAATSRSLALVSLLAIAACSGGGGRVQPVPAPDGAMSKTSRATSATLKIVIPARPTTTAGATRRARYISYATQSIKAVFTRNSDSTVTTFTQNLTPTSPGCQANLNSSVTCTLALPGLTPGGYTAAFTMYDGMLDNSNAPTGSVLSANQTAPVTILAGQANVIAVTLDGVPVALAAAPGAAATLSGNQTAGYTVSKCLGFEPARTESITVVGVDADQNFILGSGAPTPGLSSSDTTMAAVATPPPSSPNAFALSRSAMPATARTSFNLTASVTPLAGTGSTTPISATFPVSFDTTVCGVVTTLAGTGSSGFADSTSPPATFDNPFGAAVDGSGNVYVADYNNNAIRKITPGGVVSTFAGAGPGSPGFANGTGTAATFNHPTGVAVDGSGNVYVADQQNHAIRAITPGGVVSTLAGNGSQGFANGNGAAATFRDPTGVAVDGGGNLYVADQYNHAIRKITPGGDVTTLAGSGSPGYADAIGTAAAFKYPLGVAVDVGGAVYVADNNNNAIRKIAPGAIVTTLAGNASPGFTNATGTAARFNGPSGVAVDGSGNVYVADSTNNAIRTITSGGVVSTLAGSGSVGFGNGTGTAATFRNPNGVAVDGSGNVYVADTSNNAFRKIQ